MNLKTALLEASKKHGYGLRDSPGGESQNPREVLRARRWREKVLSGQRA